MRKLYVALVAVAVLLGGAVAFIIASDQPTAVAQEDGGEGASDDSATEAGDETDEPAPTEDGISGAKRSVIDEVLDDLVADGVITADQAEAVADALRDRLGRRFDHHDRDKVMPRLPIGPGLLPELDGVLDLLGGDLESVLDQLRDGKTLGEIAEELGTSRQVLIDAVVESVRARIDDAVADGLIDPERADALLDRVSEMAERLVDGELPVGLNRFGFGRGFVRDRADHLSRGSWFRPEG